MSSKMWPRLCGNSIGRQWRSKGRDVVVQQVPSISVPTTIISPSGTTVADDIVSGRLAPEDCVVEVPQHAETDTEIHNPWYTIRNLLKYVENRRRKIGLRFGRRNAYPSSNAISQTEMQNTAATANALQDENGGSNPDTSFPEAIVLACEDNASEDKAKTGSYSALPRALPKVVEAVQCGPVAKRDIEGADRASVLMTDTPTRSQGSQPFSTIHVNPAELPMTGTSFVNDLHNESAPSPTIAPQLPDSASELSIVNPSRQGSLPVDRKLEDDDEFCTSAGMIQTPLGEHKPVKLFYDTGSSDPWASEAFVKKHGFELRSILPEDLIVYNVVGGTVVIPRFYVEIEVQDEHHEVNEFTKVSFNIAKSMGGKTLLLGRTFMNTHGVMLDASKEGPGLYVTTGRKASNGKRSAVSIQAALLTFLQRIKNSKSSYSELRTKMLLEQMPYWHQLLAQRQSHLEVLQGLGLQWDGLLGPVQPSLCLARTLLLRSEL